MERSQIKEQLSILQAMKGFLPIEVLQQYLRQVKIVVFIQRILHGDSVPMDHLDRSQRLLIDCILFEIYIDLLDNLIQSIIRTVVERIGTRW